ncbi:MAG: glycosyltransferase family 4 protein [Pseudobdellovibrionaceae bacterium]
MKILFAIKNMSNAKGGAEKVLAVVMNGLAERGYDLTLLTFDNRGVGTFYKLDPRIKRVSLGIGSSSKRSRFIETWARMRAIRKVVMVRKPDIVIPFMHSMFVPTTLTLAGTGIPVIASEHIVPKHYSKNRLEYLLLIIAVLLARKATVLSASVKKLYPFFLRPKMIVMGNPVFVEGDDTDIAFKDPSRKIILNVGRLSEQKDQKTLIRAFATLAENYPQWDVRIVGEGEARPFLEELIAKHHLEDRVTLVGTTDRIYREYRHADIFAMPSKYESFGLATAEALAFGVPAVGFATCPGTNEIIADKKNGLLVKRGRNHVKNFADGLEHLMKDEALCIKYGEQGKADMEQYNFTRVIDNWERLIHETLGTQSTSNLESSR